MCGTRLMRLMLRAEHCHEEQEKVSGFILAENWPREATLNKALKLTGYARS